MIKENSYSPDKRLKTVSDYLKKPLPVLIIIAVLFLISQTPEYILEVLPEELKSLFETQNELRKALLKISGAITVLYSLSFIVRRTKLLDNIARVFKKKSITERLAKAVEQLGDTNSLKTRLGGIYALERIARDSEKDHWSVMEVLTAFVREDSPVKKEEKDYTSGKKVGADIQAILTVIGRRKKVRSEPGSIVLNFSYLREVNLKGAVLRRADLVRADFAGADLRGVNLRGADLRGADLRRANLMGAVLVRADFREADLREANLSGAFLMEANLEGVNLKGSHLGRTFLMGANLRGADLEGAHVKGAHTQGTVLVGAVLVGAVLVKADLIGANLRGANLKRANFRKANLTGADLMEADLTEAKNLTHEQLSKVKILYKTNLDSNLLEKVKEKYPHLLEDRYL
ncbi:MAG: hypothetical protein CV087_21700 [Candidatus Brocadia sp. WS118]|nr:MAG: hypothetical protein CV087_21700 [Candidatus Brocadia sp. WS118]